VVTLYYYSSESIETNSRQTSSVNKSQRKQVPVNARSQLEHKDKEKFSKNKLRAGDENTKGREFSGKPRVMLFNAGCNEKHYSRLT